MRPPLRLLEQVDSLAGRERVAYIVKTFAPIPHNHTVEKLGCRIDPVTPLSSESSVLNMPWPAVPPLTKNPLGDFFKVLVSIIPMLAVLISPSGCVQHPSK